MSYYRTGIGAPQPQVATDQPQVPPWVVALSAGAGLVGLLCLAARRPLSTRERHDREVVRVAKRLRREGFEVAADVKGWPRPPTTNGRRADVVGYRGGTMHMVEVEHAHTLDTTHTRRQVADLDRYCAKETAYRCRFELVLAR